MFFPVAKRGQDLINSEVDYANARQHGLVKSLVKKLRCETSFHANTELSSGQNGESFQKRVGIDDVSALHQQPQTFSVAVFVGRERCDQD